MNATTNNNPVSIRPTREQRTLLVHSPKYAKWVFDPSHPTQGVRFMRGAEMLKDAGSRLLDFNLDVVEPDTTIPAHLELVHTSDYIDEVGRGWTDEWEGQRVDLGNLAKLFVHGTLTALRALVNGEADIAVNLPGAKHHAQSDRSSGFCVFADFAIAAQLCAAAGLRVAILDIDAHHGDGTENLTRSNPNILTASMHEDGIFPGTGYTSEPENHVYNYPLSHRAGVTPASKAFMSMLKDASDFKPDIVFVAAGADAHETDPLSSLQLPSGIYRKFGFLLTDTFPTTPILIGGAGGYQPDTYTPIVWSEFIRGASTYRSQRFQAARNACSSSRFACASSAESLVVA